jgi:hypothetical protein
MVFEDATTWYFAPLRRWDQVFVEPSISADPDAELVLAGLRAAVFAPKTEIKRWFSRPIADATLVRLLSDGRVVEPAPGYLALASR